VTDRQVLNLPSGRTLRSPPREAARIVRPHHRGPDDIEGLLTGKQVLETVGSGAAIVVHEPQPLVARRVSSLHSFMKSARAACVDRQADVLDPLVNQAFTGEELERAVGRGVVDYEHPAAPRRLRANRLQALAEEVLSVERHYDCSNTAHTKSPLSCRRCHQPKAPLHA
jgi:hypothetical protein